MDLIHAGLCGIGVNIAISHKGKGGVNCALLCGGKAWHRFVADYAPLGMESGTIADKQITASSSWDDAHGTTRARLNTREEGAMQGAWGAGEGW